MEQKVTFGSLIKYGLLLGMALIIISLIKIYSETYLENFIEQDVIRWSFTLLETAAYVFFVYCAIRFSEKYLYTSHYSFAKGVKVAFFVGLIAAILIGIYKYIEIKFIIPAEIKEIVIPTVRAFLISLLASFFIAPFFKKRQIINSEESSSLDNQ